MKNYSFIINSILYFVPLVNFSQVLIVPPSPGDLSSVEHLFKSDDYMVEVRKVGDIAFNTCFVYKTDNYASNVYGGEKRKELSASFTNFSFDETAVEVKITVLNASVNSVTIRPLNYEIEAKYTGNEVTFILPSPKKVSVEINNRLKPLFIFSDNPDIPNTNATYYYGPGVHHVGLKKEIKSNESVYIAGGAVVEGTFKIVQNATNITIRGRGIISNGELPTLEMQGGPNNDKLFANATFSGPYIWSSKNSYITYEGFIIVNGAGWTFAFYSNSGAFHHNTWKNIKEIQWSGCTDGIWFDGDYNTIDDCFIFNNDDLVTTHGSNNCKISNTTLWGGNSVGACLCMQNGVLHRILRLKILMYSGFIHVLQC